VNALADDAPAAAAPGWFGKLACLGDFASRRLPPEFLRACDSWLSAGVEASRARLGQRWLDSYLTSPLWRFAWAPGVVDGHWWFGVMMPSVDNVGRYFPLLVALPRDEAPADGAQLDELDRWFAEVAQAALGTLQPAGTLDRFEGELQAARPFAQRAPAGEPPEETHWADRSVYRFAAGSTLAESLQQLGRHDAARRARGRSLWWSLRSRGGDNRLTVSAGLPAAEAFADLLQGGW
jgi:type VI secretion system protein ImpM